MMLDERVACDPDCVGVVVGEQLAQQRALAVVGGEREDRMDHAAQRAMPRRLRRLRDAERQRHLEVVRQEDARRRECEVDVLADVAIVDAHDPRACIEQERERGEPRHAPLRAQHSGHRRAGDHLADDEVPLHVAPELEELRDPAQADVPLPLQRVDRRLIEVPPVEAAQKDELLESRDATESRPVTIAVGATRNSLEEAVLVERLGQRKRLPARQIEAVEPPARDEVSEVHAT